MNDILSRIKELTDVGSNKVLLKESKKTVTTEDELAEAFIEGMARSFAYDRNIFEEFYGDILAEDAEYSYFKSYLTEARGGRFIRQVEQGEAATRAENERLGREYADSVNYPLDKADGQSLGKVDLSAPDKPGPKYVNEPATSTELAGMDKEKALDAAAAATPMGFLSGMFNNIKNAFISVKNSIKDFINGVPFLRDIKDKIKEIFAGGLQWITTNPLTAAAGAGVALALLVGVGAARKKMTKNKAKKFLDEVNAKRKSKGLKPISDEVLKNPKQFLKDNKDALKKEKK